MIDHGTAGTKRTIQRRLGNGQWDSCGGSYWDGLPDDHWGSLAALRRDLTALKAEHRQTAYRIRVEHVSFQDADEFLGSGQ